jgi:hypothetical protein
MDRWIARSVGVDMGKPLRDDRFGAGCGECYHAKGLHPTPLARELLLSGL